MQTLAGKLGYFTGSFAFYAITWLIRIGTVIGLIHFVLWLLPETPTEAKWLLIGIVISDLLIWKPEEDKDAG